MTYQHSAPPYVKKTYEIERSLAERFVNAIPKGKAEVQIIRELMEAYIDHQTAAGNTGLSPDAR